MSAALGDLLKYVDRQTYLGVEVLNVYYYRVTSITGLTGSYLTDIGNWLSTNVISPVANIQGSSLAHTFLEAVNLSNGLDIATIVTGFNGTLGGTDATSVPSYVTANFSLRRETAATRNGRKGISGLQEGNVSGNILVGLDTAVNNIKTALAADVVLGLVTVAEPVIVHRPIPVPAVGYTYASIGSATFNGLGSQNTRKPGSGA